MAGLGATGKKLWSVGAAWLDYDNDGDLDLFVTNYLDWTPENNRVCGTEGRRLSCSPTSYAGLPNLLYRNDGAGRFSDVSHSMRISEHVGRGMSVAVADADGDGFTDVFVANDQGRNFLFRNLGGRAFVEQGVETGVAYTEDGVPVSGMGADFRDLDAGRAPRHLPHRAQRRAVPALPQHGRGLLRAQHPRRRPGLRHGDDERLGHGRLRFRQRRPQGAVHRERARQREHRLVRIASLPPAERALPGAGRRALPRRDAGDRRGHAAPRGPSRVRLRRPGRRRARRRGGLGDRRAGRDPLQRHERRGGMDRPGARGHEEQPRRHRRRHQAHGRVRSCPVRPRDDRRGLRQLVRQAGALRPGGGPRGRARSRSAGPAGPGRRSGTSRPGRSSG